MTALCRIHKAACPYSILQYVLGEELTRLLVHKSSICRDVFKTHEVVIGFPIIIISVYYCPVC